MWYRYVPGRNGLLRPFPTIWPFHRHHELGYQQVPLADPNAPQAAVDPQQVVPHACETDHPAPLEREELPVDVNVPPVVRAAP